MSWRTVFTLAKVVVCILATTVVIAALAWWQVQPPTSSVIDGMGGGDTELGARADRACWTPEDWTIFKEKVRFAEEGGLADMELGEAIVQIAETFVGTTYEPGTLEVMGPERLVINFRALDCVTLVETVLALTRFVREQGVESLADPPAARAGGRSRGCQPTMPGAEHGPPRPPLSLRRICIQTVGTRSVSRTATRQLPPSKSTASSEHHIEALINRGGSVTPDHEERGRSRPQLVQLRLSRALVQRIDKVRKHRLVVPSRHTWLLEALLEKLETEEHLQAS